MSLALAGLIVLVTHLPSGGISRTALEYRGFISVNPEADNFYGAEVSREFAPQKVVFPRFDQGREALFSASVDAVENENRKARRDFALLSQDGIYVDRSALQPQFNEAEPIPRRSATGPLWPDQKVPVCLPSTSHHSDSVLLQDLLRGMSPRHPARRRRPIVGMSHAAGVEERLWPAARPLVAEHLLDEASAPSKESDSVRRPNPSRSESFRRSVPCVEPCAARRRSSAGQRGAERAGPGEASTDSDAAGALRPARQGGVRQPARPCASSLRPAGRACHRRGGGARLCAPTLIRTRNSGRCARRSPQPPRARNRPRGRRCGTVAAAAGPSARPQ